MIGAIYAGKEVEVDGKFLSAGPAVGSYEVGLKAVEKTVGREWAQYIEHEVLEFCPNPVYGINQHNVPRSILTITNIMSFVLRAFYRPDIKKAYCGNKPNKT
jgi:cyclohexyl-isocyanide hydratase